MFLGGNSFGCRVALEVIRNHLHDLPQMAVKDRVICFGYPLYGPKQAVPGSGTDRVQPLLELPAGHLVTFVSGEKDEFLKRSYQDTKGTDLVTFRFEREFHCPTAQLRQ